MKKRLLSFVLTICMVVGMMPMMSISASATTAPSAPDMIGTDSGISFTDNITNDNTPTFSGTAQSNSHITLRSNGNSDIGTATADGSGNWTVTASNPLADGIHTITAIASASGISSEPSNGLTITIDTVSPSEYSVDIDQAAINNSNKPAMSFSFNKAEVGSKYSYTVSSSGGGSVNGNGTITIANEQIAGINVGGLTDGTLTLSVTLNDVAGNTGVAATDTINKDTIIPVVSSFSPVINSTDASINTDMVITFSRAVTTVSGKKIIIKAASDNSTVEAITVTGINVTGSGTKIITIDPTVSLGNNTEYYIQIDAGAFKDLQGNEYAGISDATSWRFTTVGVPATHAICTGAASFDFGSLPVGYDSAPTAQIVTITNIGNQTITLTQPSISNTSSNYNFTTLSDTTLDAGETANFAIQPKDGLAVGTYNETIVINGQNGSNNVSTSVTARFSVSPPSGGGGSSTPTLITKIDIGGTVTGANVDRLVKKGETLTVEDKTGKKLVFDTEALKNIGDQTKDSLKVEIKDVSADHASKHPGKLVVSLTATAGGKNISNFGKGTATISLPYVLEPGEKAEDVTVWYLAEDGTMSEVPCSYDSKTKMATFKVNHFSLYVVGTDALANWVNPFGDIKESHWFYEAIRFVSANKLMQGTTDTTFDPKGKTTRGMIVTTLWRMENQPKAIKESTFADVKSGKYYHDAVAWASEKGIVSGYSAEKFGPEDSITREQLAVILHNYAAGKGYKTSDAGDLTAFNDAGSIHEWGKEAMAWASGEGLINGTGISLLDPSGTAERSQVAAILQRFVEKIAN